MPVETFEGAEVNQGLLDQLIARLEPGEIPIAAATVTRMEVGAFRSSLGTVLLTSRRLALVKERFFGKPKLDRCLELREVTGSGAGLLSGVGPTMEVQITAGRQLASLYFRDPVAGERFEHRLRETASLVKTVES